MVFSKSAKIASMGSALSGGDGAICAAMSPGAVLARTGLSRRLAR